MATILGLIHPGCATASADYTMLADFAGVSVEAISGMAYRPVARKAHHRFGTGMVHRDILDLSRRRICPECLVTGEHHKRTWDLSLSTACPVHGVRLVSECAKCHRGLGWSERSTSMCDCPGTLRQWTTVQAAPGEVRANERLVDLASSMRPAWLPDALANCPAPDLMWLAMCLGMFLSGWPRPRRVSALFRCAPDVRAAILAAGTECLEHWPGPLAEFLARQHAAEGERPGRFGAGKTFGAFYTWMRGIESNLVRQVVLIEARRFAERNPLLAHRMYRSKIIGGVTSTGEVANLAEAAKMLGRSTTVAKAMLVEVGGENQRGLPLAIPREAIERLQAEQGARLTMREAARRLGISRRQTEALIRVGLIHHSDVVRPPIDTMGVSDLVARLTQSVQANPEDKTVVSFKSVIRALRRVGADFPTVVGFVLDARLVPVGTDAELMGMAQLLFGRRAVRELCRALDTSADLTIQAVAERLDLKWQVVAHLSRIGILRSLNGKIPFEAVARFKVEFISMADLAADQGTSPRALMARLEWQGVVPVSGPAVDGGRQYFYRRDDLARVGEG